jgi:hypothetical protein
MKKTTSRKSRDTVPLRSLRIDSASLCSLAGRYNNHVPPRFLAPIDCSKIPALGSILKSSDTMESEGLHADEAVLNNVHIKKNPQKVPLSIFLLTAFAGDI